MRIDGLLGSVETPDSPDKWDAQITHATGLPALGVDPQDILRYIQMDVKTRVLAALDDEQVDRIARRVVELLKETKCQP